MSWTDSDTVNKHLFNLDRIVTELRDLSVLLDSAGKGLLPHHGIVEASERVKRAILTEPAAQGAITLTGETWTLLGDDNLLPGELVAAQDSGLATIYREGMDYAVDFPGGRIRRIAGGNISSGQSVQVYYLNYELLTAADYTIDYGAGEISNTTNGVLKPNTLVYLDYSLNAAAGADQLIPDAIAEAEDKILARLKEGYTASSTDQGLTTGATELTLATVCRALAARALSDGAPSAEPRSKGWRDLADGYEASAWRTLRPFLNSPAPTPGSRRSNQSWEWQ